MSRKICLLRSSAEIAALCQLHKLQESIRARLITEAEARMEFQPHAMSLPDCAHHLHLTRREAKRQEREGWLRPVLGFEDHYAESIEKRSVDLPRSWQKRASGLVHVMQLVEA